MTNSCCHRNKDGGRGSQAERPEAGDSICLFSSKTRDAAAAGFPQLLARLQSAWGKWF